MRHQIACKLSKASDLQSGPDVTAEDQQSINTFHRSYQRLKEIKAELEGKAVRSTPAELQWTIRKAHKIIHTSC